jgi:hypothetical protein
LNDGQRSPAYVHLGSTVGLKPPSLAGLFFDDRGHVCFFNRPSRVTSGVSGCPACQRAHLGRLSPQQANAGNTGATDTEIKIGQTVPFSGPYSAGAAIVNALGPIRQIVQLFAASDEQSRRFTLLPRDLANLVR